MSESPSGNLVIGDAISKLVNSAYSNGRPILIAYVNEASQARVSYRGSTQVFSPDQLALWARDPEGGLLKAIAKNPNLTLLYRDAATRTTITFYGRAHEENDDVTRARVYDSSPESERNADPECKGRPVIIDLDLVQGRTPEGPVNLQRA